MTNKFDLVNKTIFKIFNSTCYKFNLVNVHFNNVVNYFNIQCVLLVYLMQVSILSRNTSICLIFMCHKFLFMQVIFM